MSEEALVGAGSEGLTGSMPFTGQLQPWPRQNLGLVNRPMWDRGDAGSREIPAKTGKRRLAELTLIEAPAAFLHAEEWLVVTQLMEGFKTAFFDLSLKLRKHSLPDVPDFLQKRAYLVLDELNKNLQTIVGMLATSDAADNLKRYVSRVVFPYFMRSRFANRAYHKPGGYAGDYLMMEMIYNNEPAGDGKLGRLIDAWCLNTGAARAVRGRRSFLKNLLSGLCEKRRRRGLATRILNLACGTNRELFDFLAECPCSDRIVFTGVDGDPNALDYTNKHVNTFSHGASVRLLSDNVVRWAAGRDACAVGTQDVIYTAGLMDYLSDRVFTALVRRSFQHLSPGGTLIVGNFGCNNSNKAFMDEILQWRLIHRSEADLLKLFRETGFGGNVEIAAEENGINLFAIATRKQ
jgi:extracellular factor (EF) 3-hydroxypalmitic acid methyl ester biosynthesis protein